MPAKASCFVITSYPMAYQMKMGFGMRAQSLRYVPVFNLSVDFSISIFSAAKVQEEVEVEAKVVGKKERLTCVVVQIRKKGNGELIALGKQWMATTNTIANHQTSKLWRH